MTDTTNLTGKLLIAMPSMGDPRFEHSVIFMCAHSDEGSMGLIVNKSSPDVTVGSLFEQLSIEPQVPILDKPVHYGGPVEQGRGFVLHGPDYASEVSSLIIDDHFRMTATLDILESIARGQGPTRHLIMLGYAGWGPGQLEEEIAANGWLVCDATQDLVYAEPDAAKWEAALKSMGIPVMMLSAEGGRA